MCFLLALLSALAALIVFQSELVQDGTGRGALVAIGSLLLAVGTIISAAPGRWLSVPMVYLYVFAIFHLGLAPMLALGWEVPDFGNPFGARWITAPKVTEALYTVAVSMLCFALGVRAGRATGRRRGSEHPDKAPGASFAAEGRCAMVALGTAIVGVIGWFVFVFSRGGTAAFVGSYASYIDATASGALPQLYLLITMAAALTAVVPHHPRARPAALLLALFAVVALPVGLRGEVLFPLAAATAVIAKRRVLRVRPYRWLAIGLVLLSVVALGRSVRTTGIAGLGDQALDVNPVHGMAELGYSLRPVAEALAWQAGIDEPAHGRTYLRPLERGASRAVPWLEVPPAEDDTLLMNVLVLRRIGAIGFSPVAEGVVNFGLVGAAGFLALVGAVLGFLDRRSPTTANLALVAIVLVPLLVNTRNAFVPMPLQLALGSLAWLFIVRPQRPSSAVSLGHSPLNASTAPALSKGTSPHRREAGPLRTA